MNKSQQIAIENANKKLQSQSERSAGGAFMRGVGQGITMDFGDEMLAFLKSGGRVNSPEYKKHLLEIRESLKGYQEAFPKSYTGGNITGALGTALVPGGLALKGGGLLAKGAKVAGLGAGEGALTAVGAQEEEKGLNPATMDSASSGAKWGAGGALAFGGLGYGGSKIFAPLIDAVRRKYGDKLSKEAENVIKGMADKSGKNIDEVIIDIASGKMPAEQNKSLTLLTRMLASQDTKVRRLMQEAVDGKDGLGGRATERSKRAINKVRETLSPNMDANSLKQKRIELKRLAEEEDMLYQPIWDRGEEVSSEIVEELKSIISRNKNLTREAIEDIELEDGVKPFFSITEDGVVSFSKRTPTLQEAEVIYRSLRESAEVAFKGNRKQRSKKIKNMAIELKELLDEFSPDLKNARATASYNADSKKALDLGRTAMTRSVEDVENDIDDLLEIGNEEAIRFFKLGIVNGLNSVLGTRRRGSVIKDMLEEDGKKWNSLLRKIFDPEEYAQITRQLDLAEKSQGLKLALDPNTQSMTEVLRAGGEDIKSGMNKGLDALSAVASQNPLEMGRYLAMNVGGRTQLSKDQLSEVARFLVQTDSKSARDLLMSAKTQEEVDRIVNNIAETIGLTVGGATAQEMAR